MGAEGPIMGFTEKGVSESVSVGVRWPTGDYLGPAEAFGLRGAPRTHALDNGITRQWHYSKYLNV